MSTQDEKHAQQQEREKYMNDLIARKYPILQTKKEQAQARTYEVLSNREQFHQETQLQPVAQTSIETEPQLKEMNGLAEKMVADQIGFYVQMAHKHRSPRSNVPWIRVVGAELKSFRTPWSTFLRDHLLTLPNQNLSLFRFERAQPFMVCTDERHQWDTGTDKRVKRLLNLYETEFYDQRTKFQQHRTTGLTEDEHKTRSSFFAKETAWREAKRRHDVTTNNAPTECVDQEKPKPTEAVINLRNHKFPETCQQSQFQFAVISYFRDRLAFQRCFADLRVSVEEADFQPIVMVWGAFETQAQAQEYMKLTRCNHAFLQKNLLVIDMYQWIALDSENTHNIPITYANKHCNDIMSYKQAEAQAIEEYHAWERERFGSEAPFTENPMSLLPASSAPQ